MAFKWERQNIGEQMIEGRLYIYDTRLVLPSGSLS